MSLVNLKAIYILFIISIISLTGCKKSDNPVSPAPLGEGKWELVSDIGYGYGLSHLFFIDTQTGWIIGDSGKIAVTHDGGLSWSRQKGGTQNSLQSICFIDKNTGFIGGYNNTLISTTDGGLNWKPYNVSIVNNIYGNFIFYFDNVLWLMDNTSKLFSSANKGEDWTLLNDFFPGGYTYFMKFGNTAYASTFGAPFLGKSTDGGINWERMTLPVQWQNNVYFLNERLGWVTENWAPSSMHHDSASVYSTTDGGVNWTKIVSVKSLYTDNAFFVNEQTGWFTDTTRIYATQDGGRTINIQYTSSIRDYINRLYFLDKNNGWAVTFYGKVIRFSRK